MDLAVILKRYIHDSQYSQVEIVDAMMRMKRSTLMSDPENGHPLIFPDISCFSIYLRIFPLFGLRYIYVPGTEIGIRSRRRTAEGRYTEIAEKA